MLTKPTDQAIMTTKPTDSTACATMKRLIVLKRTKLGIQLQGDSMTPNQDASAFAKKHCEYMHSIKELKTDNIIEAANASGNLQWTRCCTYVGSGYKTVESAIEGWFTSTNPDDYEVDAKCSQFGWGYYKGYWMLVFFSSAKPTSPLLLLRGILNQPQCNCQLEETRYLHATE